MPTAWKKLPLPAVLFLLLVTLMLLSAACGGRGDLVLGATTSLQDTGLLDELVAAFQRESGLTVKYRVGGSGQVLEFGRRGEIDVLIAHSPSDEEQFVAEGQGIDRRPVMENSFLIVGPALDPAGVKGARTAAEAFKRIAVGERTFISRGDRSGTHVRELAIWRQTGIDPAGRSWYQESAVGQGQSLLVAGDKRAYTLVDSATYRVFRGRVDLAILFTDKEVRNRYSVVRVNPEKHSGVNAEAALAFADFLTSVAGQLIIADFGREEYGESLFTAIAPPPGATPITVNPTPSP